MTDHAAAVEAVRKRVEKLVRDAMPLVEGTTYGDCYQRDTVLMAERLIPAVTEEIATLLRAYEAVVPVLDAALAWLDAFDGTSASSLVQADAPLVNAIRAYRAAKEGT